jgi:arabinose-5-phosphate isomerase
MVTQEHETANQIDKFIDTTVHALKNLKYPRIVNSIHKSVEAICSSKGKVVVSGMGKAGIAAKKAAATFSSLGIPSCYLHPADASHGDIGIVCPDDVLLVFSTSGKTREVIETIKLSKHLGVGAVIAVTSHPDSPVRSLSDLVVDMGVIGEAGHLSIAPTTSIIVMLAISDMIATICSHNKGVTLEDYAKRHHSGYLGAVARGDGIIR